MTRPSANSLLLDGDTVKLRLLAERSDTGSAVHIDWLRFTCQLRNSPVPPVGRLFFGSGKNQNDIFKLYFRIA